MTIRSVADLHASLVITESGCWEWQGTRNYKGYGIVVTPSKCTNATAHRFVWQLQNGPVFDGLYVCHRCDNPPCCNPAHMFLGTARDNRLDCDRKGRSPYRGSQKLTTDLIAGIRRDSAAGMSRIAVGAKYGITASYVSRIVHGNRVARLTDDRMAAR